MQSYGSRCQQEQNLVLLKIGKKKELKKRKGVEGKEKGKRKRRRRNKVE
jgi:hypothetical protein